MKLLLADINEEFVARSQYSLGTTKLKIKLVPAQANFKAPWPAYRNMTNDKCLKLGILCITPTTANSELQYGQWNTILGCEESHQRFEYKSVSL